MLLIGLTGAGSPFKFVKTVDGIQLLDLKCLPACCCPPALLHLGGAARSTSQATTPMLSC